MFKTEPGKDRELLGFKEEVLSSFEFLTKEYGFHCVRSEPTFVRYESENVFVNVYHGRASFEIGVEIGKLITEPNQEEEKFYLGEIMELQGVRKNVGYTFIQASTKERVKRFVPEIAKYVKKFPVKVLQGDEDTLKKLRELQTQISQQYFKEMELSQIRQKGDKAWHERNYAEIVKLYEPVQSDLSPSEKMKLEYAKKKLEK